MYLVSFVTVMCSSSFFFLHYFATRQKDSFSSLESTASIPIFVHGRNSALVYQLLAVVDGKVKSCMVDGLCYLYSFLS